MKVYVDREFDIGLVDYTPGEKDLAYPLWLQPRWPRGHPAPTAHERWRASPGRPASHPSRSAPSKARLLGDRLALHSMIFPPNKPTNTPNPVLMSKSEVVCNAAGLAGTQ